MVTYKHPINLKSSTSLYYLMIPGFIKKLKKFGGWRVLPNLTNLNLSKVSKKYVNTPKNASEIALNEFT